MDLILVGTMGTAGLERFLLESVASKVVAHSYCPLFAEM
jgi:nucleotide-binding universal stress UspA family protein